MTTHRGRYAIHGEIMTHHQWAEIAAEKQSPLRPHQGLAAPDLFLDAILDRRTWEGCPIDYTECLGSIYGNGSQTYRSKDKTYWYAQLRELVHSIAVEHTLEHEVICGSKPAWENYGEGETVPKWQPPRTSDCEAATSSQRWRLGVAETRIRRAKAPYPVCQMSKWFMTLPPELLQEQPTQVRWCRD
jgi:hypothetical protein